MFVIIPVKHSKQKFGRSGTSEAYQIKEEPRSLRQMLLFGTCLISLVGLSLLLNYLYVTVNRSNKISTDVKLVIQVIMSFLKSLLGFQLAPRVSFILDPPLAPTANADVLERTPRVFAILIVTLSTVVLCPIIISLFVDESCFVSTLSSTALRSFSYETNSYCDTFFYNSSKSALQCSMCTATSRSVYVETIFIYAYSCGSSILANYIPVYIWAYTFALIFPLTIALVACIPPHRFPRWLPAPPGILHPSTGAEKEGFALVNVHYIIANVFTHYGVMCTFGVVAPALGLMLVISVTIQTVLWQYMIGRYIMGSPRSTQDARTHVYCCPSMDRTCARITCISAAPFIFIAFFVVTGTGLYAAELAASANASWGDAVWVAATVICEYVIFLLINHKLRPGWAKGAYARILIALSIKAKICPVGPTSSACESKESFEKKLKAVTNSERA
jgi:hypothetical protein